MTQTSIPAAVVAEARETIRILGNRSDLTAFQVLRLASAKRTIEAARAKLTRPEVTVCHCDGGAHAIGAETAPCVYFADGTKRPEYVERPESTAPRMNPEYRKRLAARSRSYSAAVGQYSRRG